MLLETQEKDDTVVQNGKFELVLLFLNVNRPQYDVDSVQAIYTSSSSFVFFPIRKERAVTQAQQAQPHQVLKLSIYRAHL
jgi:hypothetical protein